MQTATPTTPAARLGTWSGHDGDLLRGDGEVRAAIAAIDQPLFAVADDEGVAFALGGQASLDAGDNTDSGRPLLGFAPAIDPRQLGDASFCDDHGIAVPYMTGAMANGIASVELVIAGARAGLLSAYGAAGQPIDVIDDAITRIEAAVDDPSAGAFAVNLIHSPNEPVHEMKVVDLLIRRGVRLVEASAYLGLTLAAVKYRTHGICQDAGGCVVAPNRIIAKASRIEVATRWFSPPPRKMLDELVRSGDLTAEQADLAGQIPMAQDLTAEADSGGHTDNRPAVTMIPTFIALRDRLAGQFDYRLPLRVGAAGGIATPASAAAAFAMGAAYVVTGSINQACVESGSSDAVRQMLAATEQADVTMAPAADMFEMGVKLQVLKRGTMFAMRAQKLFDLYRAYDSLEAIPGTERQQIEKSIFRDNIDNVWQQTHRFFMEREPTQVDKAQRDPKHKMALVFRWYLGKSSRWANAGEPGRQMDYQVWCGPAMGAFNEWTTGTYLAEPQNRTVAAVADNILRGAAVAARQHMLRAQGVALKPQWTRIEPQRRRGTKTNQ